MNHHRWHQHVSRAERVRAFIGCMGS